MARKLGRTTDVRMALLRNLATDVIVHERVETTEAKAKELKKLVDKMVTLGKRGDLHARRQAASFLYKKKVLDGELVEANKELTKEERDETVNVLDKLLEEIANRYENVQGGYNRVLKLGRRRGEDTNMTINELIEVSDNEVAGTSADAEYSSQITDILIYLVVIKKQK